MQFNYTTSILNIALMAIHAFMMLTAAVLIFIKHKLARSIGYAANPDDDSAFSLLVHDRHTPPMR